MEEDQSEMEITNDDGKYFHSCVYIVTIFCSFAELWQSPGGYSGCPPR